MDLAAAFVINTLKVARIMVLWIALYLMDKVFQDAFVQQTLVNDKDPPDLRWLVPCALLIDTVAIGAMCVVLLLLRAMFQEGGRTFVIDKALVRLVAFDFACSSALILALGVALAHVAQDATLLRYRDVGLRGIRAFSELVLMLAMVVIPIPFYTLA